MNGRGGGDHVSSCPARASRRGGRGGPALGRGCTHPDIERLEPVLRLPPRPFAQAAIPPDARGGLGARALGPPRQRRRPCVRPPRPPWRGVLIPRPRARRPVARRWTFLSRVQTSSALVLPASG